MPDAETSDCRKVTVYDYLGRAHEFPVVQCYIRCSYFTGWADTNRIPIKFATVLIGDIPGALKSDDPVSCSDSSMPTTLLSPQAEVVTPSADASFTVFRLAVTQPQPLMSVLVWSGLVLVCIV